MYSVIAVSGMGNRKSADAFNRWCNGLRRLEDATKPILIIVYGEEGEVQGPTLLLSSSPVLFKKG